MTGLVPARLSFSIIPVMRNLLLLGKMNRSTLGPLAVVLVGVAAFGTMLTLAEQPTSCPCNGSSDPWYPCVHNPCPLMVTLNLDSYHFNTPTNLTLNVRNNGAVSVVFIAYYVKDSSGTQYSNSTWPGPSIPPAAAISSNIVIDGTAFTFQKGYSYTVTVVTSRNYQFSFSITE